LNARSNARVSMRRWTNIQNSRPATLREKGRYQMLPDKATTTCNKRLPSWASAFG